MPEAASSCQELLAAARNCQELSEGARSCQELQDLEKLPRAARRLQTFPEASRMSTRCRDLPDTLRHFQNDLSDVPRWQHPIVSQGTSGLVSSNN